MSPHATARSVSPAAASRTGSTAFWIPRPAPGSPSTATEARSRSREAVDDPVGRRARHALGAGPLVEAAQPEPAGFLRRIAQQAREQGVAGGERGTAAPARRCRAGGRAAPAGGLGRGPGRRARRRGWIGGHRGPHLPGPRPQPHGAHRGRFTADGAASSARRSPRRDRIRVARNPVIGCPPTSRWTRRPAMIDGPGHGYPRSEIVRTGGRIVDHRACRYDRLGSARPPVRSPSVPTSRRPVRFRGAKGHPNGWLVPCSVTRERRSTLY